MSNEERKDHVLIVIQNELLRSAIVQFLNANGEGRIEAVGVVNRVEALQLMDAESKRFDLVVTEPGDPATFKHFTGTLRQINMAVHIILFADDSTPKELTGLVQATVLKSANGSADALTQKVLRILAS